LHTSRSRDWWVQHAVLQLYRANNTTQGLNNLNAALICWYLGYLCVGINSSVPIYFVLGFVTQYYIRRKYPAWYLQYNYLLSAAMDGGTQVIVFILSFAVSGASGTPHPL